jgi:putative hydrolase of the HAD superfamily
VVSNASGQIAEVLARSGVCQVGEGDHVPVRVVVDSHVVGVAKPDPLIFEHALPFFEGIERHDIAYIGDSVTMDIGAARAAGLHPVLLDPYDDHPDGDFERIGSLTDLTCTLRPD